MSNLQLIECLADLLGRATEIIHEQADLLAMHGIEDDDLADRRGKVLEDARKLV